MTRRLNFQTIEWFYDLYERKRLKLDPPYQRRSVWNQSFKDYFVETILLSYPSPAIFLHEELSAEGRSLYNVVDGKQRLTTVFEFLGGRFPVSESSNLEALRGVYFQGLDEDKKKIFWGYQFLVEYLPETDEQVLNNMFDRINKNVAKLTPQELRHARLDGEFITTAEELADWMSEQLPRNVPRFGKQSKKQMKDVELVAILMMLIEKGPAGFSQSDLDEEFAYRDQNWEEKTSVEDSFRAVIGILRDLLNTEENAELSSSKLRNQADFYSLFGAVHQLRQEARLPDLATLRERLLEFVNLYDDMTNMPGSDYQDYYLAARSASSDKGPRETRIRVMKKVLLGEI